MACFRVELIQTPVFRADPEVPVQVLAYFPYRVTADALRTVVRKILLKGELLFRKIINASEISARPNAAFLIHTKRVNGIVGERIRIVVLFAQVSKGTFFRIINKNARFARYPVFIVCDMNKVAHKYVRFIGVIRKRIGIRAIFGIKNFEPLPRGS